MENFVYICGVNARAGAKMRLTALVDTGLPPGIERAVFFIPF
jgi:hypothetical protein